MTVYMPILPVGMLHLFNDCEVDDAFILPQYWNIPEYREFYSSRPWNTVIIDNALYENPDAFSIPDLIKIAESIDSLVTYIVGPEHVGDGAITSSLVLNAIAAYGPSGAKWKLMAAFQGTPNEMYGMYQALREYDIGFAIPVSMHRQGWSRSGLKYFTGVRNHYVHALGIDDLTEIPDLVRAGVDSFDSSIVATAAVNGIDLLGSALRVVRTGAPTDHARVNLLRTKFSDDIIDASACNITDIRSVIGSVKIEARGV